MSLSLVVPGLLEPWPQESRSGQAFPALEKLLARADSQSAPHSYSATLFPLFQMQDDPQITAPLSWLADTGELPQSVVYHADPVYLRADGDRVLLFPLDAGQISAEEAAACVALFNAHFKEQGLSLCAPRPQRWYLQRADADETVFPPLHEVAGRNMQLFIPDHAAAASWRALLNEVQMLFFSAAVNQQREQQGRQTISGLWFSGGGAMPRPGIRPQQLMGDEPLLRGLSAHAQGEAAGQRLEVWNQLLSAAIRGDVPQRVAAMQDFDRHLAGLMTTQTFRLYSCDGHQWHWRPRMNWRLWRRPKRFAQYSRDTRNRLSQGT